MATKDIGMSPLSWVQNGKAAGEGASFDFAQLRPPSAERNNTQRCERTSTEPAYTLSGSSGSTTTPGDV